MTAEKVPLFSICIPHYGNHNRTDFLLAAFESFAEQSMQDFEVCVSDDASPDGRQQELADSLERLGLRHVVKTREENGRYDANLRSAIGLASGRFCLLMGNDDALAGPLALQRLADALRANPECGVVISDYEDFRTSERGNRIRYTKAFPGVAGTAARRFRNFAFVSGIVFERSTAQSLATAKWDGSEMYQMWIGCRMISNGHGLLELAEAIVRKDIAIGDQVRTGSVAWRPKVSPCPIQTRPLPFNDIGRVVCDAIAPSVPTNVRKRLFFSVFYQLFTITYPFWLTEYRRFQSWNYAAGVALGMRPRRSMRSVALGPIRRGVLSALFIATTAAGLSIPLGLFNRIRPALYKYAKSGS